MRKGILLSNIDSDQSLGAFKNHNEIAKFQREDNDIQTHPHGHPDPSTLIGMKLYNPDQSWPRKQQKYILTGKKPGQLARDLQGASNQVPQWVWVAAGVFFLGYGIYSFKSKKSRKSNRVK